MKKTNVILTVLLCLLASACSKKDKVEYLPFQAEEDGRWGLISTKGEVLIADEFERKPTAVQNGRFMVRDKDGNWELYTAEAKPRQVGKTYKSIAPFTEEVTPATEPGKPVALIDRDGKVVKELNKLAGKTVASVRRFVEGLAVFETADGLYGAIDTKGNVVVEPKWCALFDASDGKLIATDNKYKAQLEKDDRKGVKFTVLDAKGKKISDLSIDKFEDIGQAFTEGVLPAWVKDGDKTRCGLINEKGEYVLRPTSKAERIGEYHDGNFTYYDGEAWGLMKMDGTVAIRAKYDLLVFASDKLLFAYDGDKSNSEQWKLIDLEGNDVGTETFEEPAYTFINGYAAVKLGKNDWGFIDTNGKLLDLPGMNIARIDYNDADYVVESDYIDINALIEALHITKQGIDLLTLNTPAAEAARTEKQQDAGDAAPVEPDPKDYTWKDYVSYTKYIKPAEANIMATFPENIGQAVKQPVYLYGYHIYDETTGYRFTSTKPAVVSCSFSNVGKLEGKMKDVFQALSKKATSFGRTVKQNKNAIVVRIDDGHYAMSILTDENASLYIAQGDAQAIDITSYAEESEPTADYAATDSVVVDSLAADTMAVAY